MLGCTAVRSYASFLDKVPGFVAGDCVAGGLFFSRLFPSQKKIQVFLMDTAMSGYV